MAPPHDPQALNLLEEIDGEYYRFFDYLRSVKLDSRQITMDYGSTAAFRLNSSCPVVVKRGGLAYLDEVVRDYGFESTDALFYHIIGYVPKYRRIWEYISHLCVEKA